VKCLFKVENLNVFARSALPGQVAAGEGGNLEFDVDDER
jgi:hypothetical protein